MALVRKMNAGAKTPTLYKYLDADYDYNSLRESTDPGVNEYIAGLNRGKKDYFLFYDAYNHILDRLKSGRAYFKDGKFWDIDNLLPTNVYWKDKDRDKDYYGLMAAYIYDKMQTLSKYTPEEDKTKIKFKGPESVGLAFNRLLFNLDNPSPEMIDAFIGMDEPVNGIRPLKARFGEFAQAASTLRNDWDKMFTEFTQEDRDKYIPLLENFYNAAANELLDPSDMISFYRAMSGVPFDRLTYTGNGYGRSVEDRQLDAATTLTLQLRLKFLQYMDERWPLYTGGYNDPISYFNHVDDRLRANISKYSLKLSNYDALTLVNLINNIVSNPEVNYYEYPDIAEAFKSESYLSNQSILYAALDALKSKPGALYAMSDSADNTRYYIGSTYNQARLSGVVWDTNAHTLSETSIHDIPYWRNKIMNDFNHWLADHSDGGTQPHWADTLGYYEKGGIIKAYNGWRSSADRSWLALDDTAENARDTKKWEGYYRNNDIDNDISNLDWLSEDFKNNPSKLADALNAVEDAYSDLDKKGLWQRVLNKTGFLDFNKAFLVTGLNKYFGYNPDKNTYLGPSTWNRHSLYDWLKSTYTLTLEKEGDNIKPKINGFNIGNQVIFWDPSVNRWNVLYTGDPLLKTRPDGLVEGGQYTPPGQTGETGAGGADGTEGSEVIPWWQKSKPKWYDKAVDITQSVLGDLTPDLISSHRLAHSIHTNNLIARVSDKAVGEVPLLYRELDVPVKGALGLMSLYDLAANDLESQSDKPFTPSPELTSSRWLDAHIKANLLREQGWRIDEAEIKRTQEEKLKLLRENLARRIATDFYNRQELQRVREERASIETSRLKKNWQGTDNYLKGIEVDLRTMKAKRDANMESALDTIYSSLYRDAVQTLDDLYDKKYPNASPTDKLYNSTYTNALLQLRAQLMRDWWEAYSSYGAWRKNPYVGQPTTSYADILSKVKFKKGGKLIPKSKNFK